jgi:hypothetical protein
MKNGFIGVNQIIHTIKIAFGSDEMRDHLIVKILLQQRTCCDFYENCVSGKTTNNLLFFFNEMGVLGKTT